MDKINEYFKNDALSNSLLGLMLNPRWVRLRKENPEIEDDDKKYFRIGAALDCLLTSPERWDEDFDVIDVARPYGLMGKFIDNLPVGITMFSAESAYQEAYDNSGYKMKMERVIENFWKNDDFYKYYLAVKGSDNGKTIISKDEYDVVEKCKGLILANSFVHKYFFPVKLGTEVMRQVPIYFEHKNQKCKALLDGILIDHQNKTIQPYDLKTIGKSVYDFPISYLQFGYYRQCAFYELALYSDASPIKDLLDEGYTMLDFMFIVVETKLSSSHPAVIYRTSKDDRLCGLDGGYRGQRYYKGINQLIDDYLFYTENDYWELPRELYENSGEISLNIFDNADSTKEHIISDTDS